MARIITYGLIAEHNLGCSSILHGVYELLRQVYHDDFEMINLQIGTVSQHAISDMSFTTLP